MLLPLRHVPRAYNFALNPLFRVENNRILSCFYKRKTTNWVKQLYYHIVIDIKRLSHAIQGSGKPQDIVTSSYLSVNSLAFLSELYKAFSSIWQQHSWLLHLMSLNIPIKLVFECPNIQSARIKAYQLIFILCWWEKMCIR